MAFRRHRQIRPPFRKPLGCVRPVERKMESMQVFAQAAERRNRLRRQMIIWVKIRLITHQLHRQLVHLLTLRILQRIITGHFFSTTMRQMNKLTSYYLVKLQKKRNLLGLARNVTAATRPLIHIAEYVIIKNHHHLRRKNHKTLPVAHGPVLSVEQAILDIRRTVRSVMKRNHHQRIKTNITDNLTLSTCSMLKTERVFV